MGDNVVKRGYLYCSSRGLLQSHNWPKRYYALCDSTPAKREAARLDWFDSEEEFKREPTERRTIFLEEIKEISAPKRQFNNLWIFDIITHKMKYQLGAENEEEVREWVDQITSVYTLEKKMNARGSNGSSLQSWSSADNECVFDDNVLYEAAEETAMYKVKIMPTEAAKRHDLGNGEYTLLLSSLNITLCKPETKMPQLVWPYKYIRRYGKSRNSFTLEAGRKCPNGEGVFTFLTSVGTEVFQRVQEFVRKMKHREHSSIGGPEGVSNVDAASNRSSRSPTPRSPTQLRPTPAKKPASISNTAPGPARNVMDSVSNNNENEKRRYMNVNVSGSVTQKPPPEPEYAVYEVTPQYRHKSDSDRPVANTTYAEPKIPERDAWIKHGMNRDNVHEETYNRTLNQDEDPYYSEVPGGMAALATEFKRNTAIQRLTKARSAPCADEENAYDHVGKGGFSRPSIGEDSTYALPGRLGSKSISGGYSAAAPVKKGRQPKRQNKPTEDSVYCEIGGHH